MTPFFYNFQDSGGKECPSNAIKIPEHPAKVKLLDDVVAFESPTLPGTMSIISIDKRNGRMKKLGLRVEYLRTNDRDILNRNHTYGLTINASQTPEKITITAQNGAERSIVIIYQADKKP